MSDPEAPTPQEGSPLLNLRSRREEIAARQYDDVEVPRWDDPYLTVRYRIIDHPSIRRGQTKVDKAPKARRFETEVTVNSDLLVKGFVGLIAIINGVPHALVDTDQWVEMDEDQEAGEWFDASRFSPLGPEIAATLGAPAETATACLRHLFIADGDLLSHAQRLIEFSGYKQAEVDDELRGES